MPRIQENFGAVLSPFRRFSVIMLPMLINIILLTISTLIWGFGFIAARWTFEVFDPYWSTALRFVIAGLLGIPFLLYRKSFHPKNIKNLKYAFIGACFLFVTLLLQTVGLSSTTVAKSGFITTLYALFTPLFMMAFSHKKYRRTFWFLIFMAMIGMALMCNLEITNLNSGDFLTLICAMSAACHIIFIGFIAHEIASPIEFNFIQNIFVGLFTLITAFIVKGKINLTPLLNIHSHAVEGILFLGVISSMIAFTIQIVAQKKIPAHIAGLIFLMESPFAAVFGYFYFHEVLSVMNIVGAAMIMLAVLLVPILGKEVSATL